MIYTLELFVEYLLLQTEVHNDTPHLFHEIVLVLCEKITCSLLPLNSTTGKSEVLRTDLTDLETRSEGVGPSK